MASDGSVAMRWYRDRLDEGYEIVRETAWDSAFPRWRWELRDAQGRYVKTVRRDVLRRLRALGYLPDAGKQ
jgi:hypothetical protein